jgi:hypothetical protein
MHEDKDDSGRSRSTRKEDREEAYQNQDQRSSLQEERDQMTRERHIPEQMRFQNDR